MAYDKRLVLKFISSCNEMINGKFILADNKVNAILKDISLSEEIQKLIEECLKNFNFNREFSMAKVKTPTKPGYFVLPKEKEVIIPLVFCLLVDIKNRSLDLSQFLVDYFSTEGEDGITGYAKFGKEVIEPFKNAIADCFELPRDVVLDDNTPLHKESELEEKQEPVVDVAKQLFCDEVLKIASEMINELKLDYKTKPEIKEDAIYILETMQEASLNLEISYINALVVAYRYVEQKIKLKSSWSFELYNAIDKYYQY